MLKSNQDRVRVFFKVVTTGKRYECFVSMNATLQDCLILLSKLVYKEQNNYYQIDSHSLVYEEFSLQYCAIDVPFLNLNVYDGISFLIF